MTLRQSRVLAIAALVLGAASGASLLAGTCAFMPSFSDIGATCTAANAAVECRCGECFHVDASPLPDPAYGWPTSLHMHRLDMDGTTHDWVKLADPRLPTVNEDGVLVQPWASLWWCPAKDDQGAMPLEGRTYKYSSYLCFALNGVPDGICNAASASITYIGAPYAWSGHFNVKGN